MGFFLELSLASVHINIIYIYIYMYKYGEGCTFLTCTSFLSERRSFS